MADRRQHERFTPSAGYALRLRIHGVVYDASAAELSVGGALVRAALPFAVPVGSEIEVELSKGAGPIKTQARVLRGDKDNLALAFINATNGLDNGLPAINPRPATRDQGYHRRKLRRC